LIAVNSWLVLCKSEKLASALSMDLPRREDEYFPPGGSQNNLSLDVLEGSIVIVIVVISRFGIVVDTIVAIIICR